MSARSRKEVSEQAVSGMQNEARRPEPAAGRGDELRGDERKYAIKVSSGKLATMGSKARSAEVRSRSTR